MVRARRCKYPSANMIGFCLRIPYPTTWNSWARVDGTSLPPRHALGLEGFHCRTFSMPKGSKLQNAEYSGLLYLTLKDCFGLSSTPCCSFLAPLRSPPVVFAVEGAEPGVVVAMHDEDSHTPALPETVSEREVVTCFK